MISKKDAEDIALRHVATSLRNAVQKWDVPWAPRAIERPSKLAFYVAPGVPAWYIHTPWLDGHVALRSSRVLAISKSDGRVLYDGSANDEG
jgi:hypothetical protein